MRITSFSYIKKELNFTKPVMVKGQLLNKKQIIYLKLVTKDHLGIGEISPLPGFHKYNIDNCITILENLNVKFLNTYLNYIINFDIIYKTNNIFDSNIWAKIKISSENFTELNKNLNTAIRFAIESAILQLLFQTIKKNNAPYNESIKINTARLMNINSTNTIKAKYLKIKVGRNNIQDDINIIKNVIKKFPDSKLRLDANARWVKDEFKHFLLEINKLGLNENIEFIEEPLININDYLSIESNINIALDESISLVFNSVDETAIKPRLRKILNLTIINYFVIKPVYAGALSGSINLIRENNFSQKNYIISSSYESALGFHALLYLCCFTINSYKAMGLDTLKFSSQSMHPNFKYDKEIFKFNTNSLFNTYNI